MIQIISINTLAIVYSSLILLNPIASVKMRSSGVNWTKADRTLRWQDLVNRKKIERI